MGDRFKYLFCAIGASIQGYPFMRKVLIIDGTHLRGKYGGFLLTTSAKNENCQIFPMAYAVVDSENDKAWEFFLSKLSLFVPHEEDVEFISDRHQSIFPALDKVYPGVQHCACVLHLKRNIKSTYKNKFLTARAYKKQEFNSLFNEIGFVNKKCAEYVENIGFKHWVRCHFEGDRYDIVTSNVAESWNSVLREAREFPIITLIEYIRSKLMTWFSERRKESNNHMEPVTKKVCALMASNFVASSGFGVAHIIGSEFEVKNKERTPFKVHLTKMMCTCKDFQTLKFPCEHTVAAAISSRVSVNSLVAKEYSIKNWRNAYAGTINPATPIDEAAELANALSALEMFPPST